MLKMLKEKESVVKWHPECPEVFDKMSINWNGEVTACCMDSDNLMLIGDVKTDAIKTIWNCDKLNEYRTILADMRHEDLPLCTNCYDTHSLQNPGLQGT